MQTLMLRSLLTSILILALVSCGTSQRSAPESSGPDVVQSESTSVSDLLRLSRTSQRPLAESYLLSAIEILLRQGELARAAELVTEIEDVDSLDPNLQLRYTIVRGNLYLQQDLAEEALGWLRAGVATATSVQDTALQQSLGILLAEAYLRTDQPVQAAQELIQLNTRIPASPDSPVPNQIWDLLEDLSDAQLNSMAGTADSYETRGWVELARQVRMNRISIRTQLDAIERWRTVWAEHSAQSRPPGQLNSLQTIWDQRPRHIALLLPLQDQVGRAVQEGFLSAYYEAVGLGIEVPRLTLLDTTPLTAPGAQNDVHGLYDTAVSQGADLIIGPLDKALVRQLQNNGNLALPTMALNYTDTAERNSSNLFQFGLAPEDEIQQVAQLAKQAGFSNAAIISPSGADYQRLQDAFADYWQSLGGEVVSRASFSNENEYPELVKHLLSIDASETRAARIRSLLPRSDIEFTPRVRQDIDFIFLLANPVQGRQIKPTLAFYFAGELPVYSLSAIYDGLDDTSQRANQDLNGIIFTDAPWVLENQDPLKQEVIQTLRPTQGPLQRLRALGVDSFRLYSRLGQLSSGEISSFPGVTGNLTMTSYGAIQRKPQNAVFVEGRPQILPAEDGSPTAR